MKPFRLKHLCPWLTATLFTTAAFLGGCEQDPRVKTTKVADDKNAAAAAPAKPAAGHHGNLGALYYWNGRDDLPNTAFRIVDE